MLGRSAVRPSSRPRPWLARSTRSWSAAVRASGGSGGSGAGMNALNGSPAALTWTYVPTFRIATAGDRQLLTRTLI